MVNKIKIDKDNEDGFYEPSDSEDDYNEREKKLLKKVRNRKKRDTDDNIAVLGFDEEKNEDDDEDDDDFDDKFEGESDFEDERDDGIPDARAWGQKRKDFYSTDFVDPDYSSFNDKEAELAEQEEIESKAIQLRLAQQLNEADFTLNVYGTAAVSEKDETEAKTHLKSDLSDLSHRQKVQLFKKDSPEFEGLVQDFQQHLEESQSLLEPILDYVEKNKLPSLPIFEFVATKNNLILTYCSNVSFYLVLKAQRSSIKNHPLVKRLVQMRQLLQQLQEKYDRVIKPQLEKFLQDIRDGHELIFEDSPKKMAKKSKKLQLLTAMDVDHGKEDEAASDEDEKETPNMETDSENEQTDEDGEHADGNDDGADDRRQITYQMSKNKGLTPHRKKELRNPRVKHRNKFRKAIIRRKGAVRTVRKELKRYGGEVSGIKATTKKGVKIH
ncbi:something about silencing protein 10 [Bradysia coprophila]|uniref:something about silencing protein 10 n=1 Tax=Bradysia coprophila TaxID=38358 RepID=UPI00187D88F9|nr:something about silencing protein 10 [Bradysia coprophila]